MFCKRIKKACDDRGAGLHDDACSMFYRAATLKSGAAAGELSRERLEMARGGTGSKRDETGGMRSNGGQQNDKGGKGKRRGRGDMKGAGGAGGGTSCHVFRVRYDGTRGVTARQITVSSDEADIATVAAVTIEVAAVAVADENAQHALLTRACRTLLSFFTGTDWGSRRGSDTSSSLNVRAVILEGPLPPHRTEGDVLFSRALHAAFIEHVTKGEKQLHLRCFVYPPPRSCCTTSSRDAMLTAFRSALLHNFYTHPGSNWLQSARGGGDVKFSGTRLRETARGQLVGCDSATTDSLMQINYEVNLDMLFGLLCDKGERREEWKREDEEKIGRVEEQREEKRREEKRTCSVWCAVV